MNICDDAKEYESVQNLGMDEFYYLVRNKYKKAGGKSDEEKIDEWLYS